MKKIILSTFIIALFVTACKKDPEFQFKMPSLVGKWGIVNIMDREVVNGATVYEDNYAGQPSDYMEFKNNNTLSYFIYGFGFTLNHRLLPENKVEIAGDTLTIQNLITNSATLIQKEIYGVNTYDETTYNLKR